MTPALTPRLLTDVLIAMRPAQWTKNLFVLAAFFFAFWDRSRVESHLEPLRAGDFLTVAAAAILFCLASSAVYLLNDIRDVEADRRHPEKRDRPLAAGRITMPQALMSATGLLVVCFLGSCILSQPLTCVLFTYVTLQLAYSLWLKQVAMLDVFVIAAGFVLRAIAGAVVLHDVGISAWLLLCTFLIALFLGLCKRRHEKQLLDDEDAAGHRPSLLHYDRALLDHLIVVAAACTIVSYSIYTLWPDTTRKFGTSALGFTIPFVIFGIFRYMDLVYRHDKGGQPERILLTDIPLIVDLLLYALAVFCIFHARG